MIGKTVSHYKILEKLGEGGMGVVYKAEDTKLKRIVALKFLPPELTRDENAKTRFIHEARAASALQHHNICTIHEIDETPEGQFFIAMDCYQGETLKEKIARGPLAVEEAVDIASQVAAGLSKAHEAGMVHRDIKPANAMVTTDGVVKLLDFGLAKLAGQTKMTKTGTTVGTVSYMSPEQAKGEEVDARSDIFSLGAVFYEMLTGAVPFPGDHEAAVLYGIIHGEPKPLVEVDKTIPQQLQGIIDQALKKDPKERYQNVLDLGDDLDAVSAEAGESGKARRRRPRRMRGAASPARARRNIAVAAATVVVLAVVGLILGPRFWKSVHVTPAHALAVMDFRDLATPDDPTVSAGMTELVNIGLIQASPVRVISSEYLHDLSRRLFGVVKGPIEESQKIEVARKAEATLLLVATIGMSGESRFVTWRLVDAKSGKNVGAERAEGITLTRLADEIINEVLPMIASASGTKVTAAPSAVENMTTDSPRAYQHYMAGLLASEEGRTDDAIAEFDRAVAQDTTFALAYLELGRMYWGSGYLEKDKGREYTEKAWNHRSRLSAKDQMRVQARRQAIAGPLLDAIATLQEMRKRWPDDRQVLRDLANIYWFHWLPAEAVAVAEEGLRLYPDDSILGGPSYLGTLVTLGRTEEALRATQSWVKRHPGEPNSWDELGWRYLAVGLPDSAEAAFRKAVELDPTWNPQNFCYCDYHRGDLKGATSCFEKVLEQTNLGELKRHDLVVLSPFGINLAALYIEAGRYQKARDVIREYMTFPGIDLPEFRLFVEMGQAQEVIGLYRQWTLYWMEQDAKSMPPDSVHFTAEDSTIGFYPRALGRALAMLGDAEGARKAAKKLSEVASGGGGMARYDAVEAEAWAALADHDPKTALECLGKMKKCGVFIGGYLDIDYRTALAMAYRMEGRLQEAADVHKEMLRIYGGHALSHYELGQIYEEMKRPTDAKKEYAKFLEMWSEADEGLPQLIDARRRLAAP